MALKRYADAHRALKVFNEPQRLARDAAVALGERDFRKATRLLEQLKTIAEDPEAYTAAVESLDVGRYPDWWEGRRFSGPVRAWAAGKTNETTRDVPGALGSARGAGRQENDC